MAVGTSTSEVPVELELDLEVLVGAGMAAVVVRSRCWSTAEGLEDIEGVRLGERTRKVWGLGGEAMVEEFEGFEGLAVRFYGSRGGCGREVWGRCGWLTTVRSDALG